MNWNTMKDTQEDIDYCLKCTLPASKCRGDYEFCRKEKMVYSANKALKERTKKRREQGLCTYCGKPLTDKTFVLCEECRARQREVHAMHRQ